VNLATCLLLPVRQGIRFDPDLPQTLRLEFAKTNTKVVKPKQQLAQLALAAAAAGQTPYIQPIAGVTRKHVVQYQSSLLALLIQRGLGQIYSSHRFHASAVQAAVLCWSSKTLLSAEGCDCFAEYWLRSVRFLYGRRGIFAVFCDSLRLWNRIEARLEPRKVWKGITNLQRLWR